MDKGKRIMKIYILVDAYEGYDGELTVVCYGSFTDKRKAEDKLMKLSRSTVLATYNLQIIESTIKE